MRERHRPEERQQGKQKPDVQEACLAGRHRMRREDRNAKRREQIKGNHSIGQRWPAKQTHKAKDCRKREKRQHNDVH